MKLEDRILMPEDVEKLYDAVVDVKLTVARIESLQAERHGANTASLDNIKSNIKNLWRDTCNKPCDTNGQKIKTLEDSLHEHVTRIYWLVFVVIFLGVIVGVWIKG